MLARTRDYDANRGRTPRLVILDPLEHVVYTRTRRSRRLVEDLALQQILDDKGRDALRRFAMRNCLGFAEGVVP